jgi:hypothetical protein
LDAGDIILSQNSYLNIRKLTLKVIELNIKFSFFISNQGLPFTYEIKGLGLKLQRKGISLESFKMLVFELRSCKAHAPHQATPSPK